MKSSALIIILSMVLMASCKKVEGPAINRETMVKILTDMHISDAVLANVNPGIKDSISRDYLNEILKIHKVNKQDFESSVKYYESNPELLESMYDEVYKQLEEGVNEHGK